MTETIEALVEGGEASAGPPLGPALGPMDINVMDVVNEINEKTSEFQGMEVPVTVEVDEEAGTFTVDVGTPPTSQLVMDELGIEGGSGTPNMEKVGDISLEQAIRVAGMKKSDLLGASEKARTLEILGSCNSMGVTCEGKDPRDVQQEIKAGKHDDLFED